MSYIKPQKNPASDEQIFGETEVLFLHHGTLYLLANIYISVTLSDVAVQTLL